MDEKNPDRVVKCACGKVMRWKNWGEHVKTCRRGVSRVTSDDVNTLLTNEKTEREAK